MRLCANCCEFEPKQPGTKGNCAGCGKCVLLYEVPNPRYIQAGEQRVGKWVSGEPVASPQATRPECKRAWCARPHNHEGPCSISPDDFTNAHYRNRAAQPAVGTTPCEICGERLPKGEEMFKYHGYSGNCPKPPLNKPRRTLEAAEEKLSENGIIWEEGKGYVFNGKS